MFWGKKASPQPVQKTGLEEVVEYFLEGCDKYLLPKVFGDFQNYLRNGMDQSTIEQKMGECICSLEEKYGKVNAHLRVNNLFGLLENRRERLCEQNKGEDFNRIVLSTYGKIEILREKLGFTYSKVEEFR